MLASAGQNQSRYQQSSYGHFPLDRKCIAEYIGKHSVLSKSHDAIFRQGSVMYRRWILIWLTLLRSLQQVSKRVPILGGGGITIANPEHNTGSSHHDTEPPIEPAAWAVLEQYK